MNTTAFVAALTLMSTSAFAQAAAAPAQQPAVAPAPAAAAPAAAPAPVVAPAPAMVVSTDPAATRAAPVASDVYKRDGFYIGFGVGGGSGTAAMSGVTGSSSGYFGDGREGGVAFNFRLGAAITPKLLLGGNLGGWAASKEYGGTKLTVTNVRISPELTFYPLADHVGLANGFYVRGGGGLGAVQSKIEPVSRSGASITSDMYQGLAVHLGTGVETKLATNFFLGLGVDFHQAWLAKDINTNQVEALVTFMWY